MNTAAQQPAQPPAPANTAQSSPVADTRRKRTCDHSGRKIESLIRDKVVFVSSKGSGAEPINVNFSNASDESLLAYYESVRRQVQADLNTGGKFRFVGASTKQYAEKLREEMDRRRLRFVPIDWHL